MLVCYASLSYDCISMPSFSCGSNPSKSFYMTIQISSVIAKVQKLLSLANSTSANEAANATAAANKLIEEYRLSEIDIATDNSESDPMIEDDSYIYETGRVIPWKNILIHVLTTHYGVAHYNDTYFPEGRKVSRFKLIGRSSDIQIVRYMFTWLTVECQRLANLQVKGQGRITVASYCEGFVTGISIQLLASRKEVQQTATSAAIIKLDARLQESNTFMYNQHSDIKKVKYQTKSRLDSQAFGAGQQQGRNIHLGSALGTSKTKLLS